MGSANEINFTAKSYIILFIYQVNVHESWVDSSIVGYGYTDMLTVKDNSSLRMCNEGLC